MVARVCAAGTSKAIVLGYVQLYFESGGRGRWFLLFFEFSGNSFY